MQIPYHLHPARQGAHPALSNSLGSVIRYGAAGGDDVFAKVKGLITDMISKLEAEAKSEATEKAYCDEELAKTEAKKSELESEISKLTSKIDLAAAKSAGLKWGPYGSLWAHMDPKHPKEYVNKSP